MKCLFLMWSVFQELTVDILRELGLGNLVYQMKKR